MRKSGSRKLSDKELNEVEGGYKLNRSGDKIKLTQEEAAEITKVIQEGYGIDVDVPAEKWLLNTIVTRSGDKVEDVLKARGYEFQGYE